MEGDPEDTLAQELRTLLDDEEWAAAHEIYEEKGIEAARDWFDQWPRKQSEEYYPGVFEAELEVPPAPKRVKARGGRVKYAAGGKFRKFTRRDFLKGTGAATTVATLGPGKAGVRKGLPEVAEKAPTPDFERLEPLSEKVIGTGGRGKLNATLEEIIDIFGEPDDWLYESGDGKTTVEWDLEMDDGSIVTIYDYKDFDWWLQDKYNTSRYRRLPEGRTLDDLHVEYLETIEDWHVGGNKNAMEKLKEIVGEKAETDKEFLGRKHPGMFNDEGDLMAEGGRVKYAGGGSVAKAIKKLRAARRHLTEGSDPDIEYVAREIEQIPGAESLGKRMRILGGDHLRETSKARYTPREAEQLWERLMTQFDETLEKMDPEGAVERSELVKGLTEGREWPRWSGDLDPGARKWIEAEVRDIDMTVDEFLEEAWKQRTRRKPGPIQGL
jgi:hypothetical protein